MPRDAASPHAKPQRQLSRELGGALQVEGWSVNLDDPPHHHLDLWAAKGETVVAVEIKQARAARHDLVLGRLAHALLHAAAWARDRQPVGVVALEGATESLLARLDAEVPRLLEGIQDRRPGWGVMSDGTLVRFSVPGTLDVRREPQHRGPRVTPHAFDPFTDRGQWLLKVLLAPMLSPEWIRGGDAELESMSAAPLARNAYQLARQAAVSVPTADRVVRWLRTEGFLDAGRGGLHVRRSAALLGLWRDRYPGPRAAIGARWTIPTRDPLARLEGWLRGQSPAEPIRPGGLAVLRPRACFASFTACDRMRVGVVSGLAPRLYLEDISRQMEELALRVTLAGESPEVVLMEPSAPESVFRAAVFHEGVPTADILQCWLDMRHERARGVEQAEELERGPLSDLLRERGST